MIKVEGDDSMRILQRLKLHHRQNWTASRNMSSRDCYRYGSGAEPGL